MKICDRVVRIIYRAQQSLPVVFVALGLAGMFASGAPAAAFGPEDRLQSVEGAPGEVADLSGPAGVWYLNANKFPLTVTITESAPGSFRGTLVSESTGVLEQVDNISWDPSARRLEFHRVPRQWYRGTVVDGIFVGRFSHDNQNFARPSQLTAYTYHVTGWNSTYLDRDITPRVYEVLANGNFRGRLRIDRSPSNPGQFIGRVKYYGTIASKENEGLEYDLEVTRWDGTNIQFIRRGPGTLQVYTGVAKGRKISGTFTQANTSTIFVWSGVRAEVLSYGLTGKSPEGRAEWQIRTRRRLQHLLMADNPAPLSRDVTVLGGTQTPLASASLPIYRDDDIPIWPQKYQMAELAFDYTLPNPYDGPPLTRHAHGYLAVPLTPPPDTGKYPAVVAVNGHGGSAYSVMHPAVDWYGDAFARRGFVVLALDISHRPPADRRGSYDERPDGDDPAHGNLSHPSVKAPGFDSDWEEDGERAWDAMRGLDYLLSLPYVDPDRTLITGLSMGGEVTTIAGALDPRFALVLPAGYSPDLGLSTYNRHRCWQGLNSDIRDYVDMSDYHALIAPRPLIVETGKQDNVFSLSPYPFASDKQVARRSHIAYGTDVDKFVHYLHYDVHHYHVGDFNPTQPTERGVRVPVVIAPEAPGSLTWQTDANTRTDGSTLFDVITAYLY